jgi:hypothetical protein
MSTIDIGDTVIILGGRNKGLRAIVVDKTAKMFYLTLVPDQRVIRVMQYTVGSSTSPQLLGRTSASSNNNTKFFVYKLLRN